jgi:hypothetical protein
LSEVEIKIYLKEKASYPGIIPTQRALEIMPDIICVDLLRAQTYPAILGH